MDRYSIKFQRSKKNNFGGWSFFEIKNYDGREINLIYQPEEGFLLTFVLSKGGNNTLSPRSVRFRVYIVFR